MPANEVCEGYVFTGVCLSTRGGGACVVAPGGRGMRGCSGDVRGCSRGHVWLLPGMWVVAPGGHAWLLGGVCGCLGGHVWLLWGGMHGCCWGVCVVAPGGHAWDTTRYGDTINERAVRILLECILVIA